MSIQSYTFSENLSASFLAKATATAIPNLTNALITQYVSESIAVGKAYARLTQVAVEALCIDNSISYVTQVVTELLGVNASLGIITQVATELLCGTHMDTPVQCDVPNMCVNPIPIVPIDASLPRFPLQGDAIAYNLDSSSVSLIVNERGNAQFPVGLYAFYEKHGSVYYVYKTADRNWTTTECLVTCSLAIGILDSRTVFDCDGYPVTVYENKQGYIGVHFYIQGVGRDTITPFQGTSPNVISFNHNVIAMFIPNGYTNFLNFISSSSCYTLLCRYMVNVPGSLQSFTMRQKDVESALTFSFTTILNGQSQVYFANT